MLYRIGGLVVDLDLDLFLFKDPSLGGNTGVSCGTVSSLSCDVLIVPDSFGGRSGG